MCLVSEEAESIQVNCVSVMLVMLCSYVVLCNFCNYYRVLMFVCVCVCLCVCVCVLDNSKNNGSIDLKLEHIVVYENGSDEFDIGHCPIKVKVTA